MNVEARHTTTLLEIRSFLARRAVAPEPWSSSSAAVDALLELLRARRDDPVFWRELEELVERLDDARVHPRLLEGAEVLGRATVAELLEALREALPPEETSARSWIRGIDAARALAAFLLLGAAVGCPPTDSEYEACAEAPDGLSEANSEVYCDLVALVDDSDVDSATQAEVLDCLPGMTDTERRDLLDAFLDYNDEELASALEQMALDCDDPGDDDDIGDDDDH